jgi:hypothetical protein
MQNWWFTTHDDQSLIDILLEETELYAHQIQGDNLKPKSFNFLRITLFYWLKNLSDFVSPKKYIYDV